VQSVWFSAAMPVSLVASQEQLPTPVAPQNVPPPRQVTPGTTAVPRATHHRTRQHAAIDNPHRTLRGHPQWSAVRLALRPSPADSIHSTPPESNRRARSSCANRTYGVFLPQHRRGNRHTAYFERHEDGSYSLIS
jgi:hypothetical protein